MGCDHYENQCGIVAPCCGLEFGCRRCHNETQRECCPALERSDIVSVVCGVCGTVQSKAASCTQCGLLFATFCCLACSIWESNEDKHIYHCDECGLCRVGPREKYYHCGTCQACLPVSIRDTHKCLKEGMKNDCPICLEPMFDSLTSCSIMRQCGHFIHEACLEEYQRIPGSSYDGRCLYCRAEPLKPQIAPRANLPVHESSVDESEDFHDDDDFNQFTSGMSSAGGSELSFSFDGDDDDADAGSAADDDDAEFDAAELDAADYAGDDLNDEGEINMYIQEQLHIMNEFGQEALRLPSEFEEPDSGSDVADDGADTYSDYPDYPTSGLDAAELTVTDDLNELMSRGDLEVEIAANLALFTNMRLESAADWRDDDEAWDDYD